MTNLLFPPNKRAEVRLFCFPFAAGNASAYLKLKSKLPEWLDVCLIELPGHGIRRDESLESDIKILTEDLAIELKTHLDKPYLFFGHSMGAMIAFELGHYFQKYPANLNLMPLSVIISGRCAPNHQQLGNNHHLLDDDDLIEKLSRFGGFPKEFEESKELRDFMMPVIRNDMKLVELAELSQISLGKLACPVLALSGTDEPDFNYNSLCAWENYTTQWHGAKQIDGGHFYFQEPYALDKLCEIICKYVEKLL